MKQKNTRTKQLHYRNVDYPHPFPHDFHFIHKSVCPYNTYIFIYIISECNQIKERNSVRLTWGRNNRNICIRFIIGIGKYVCYKNYEIENHIYKDIFQINIQESFANETLFNLYTMKYLNELCPYAKYYAKFDVDTYVYINRLISELNKENKYKSKFWGAEKQKWKRVNSDQSFKYSSPMFAAKYYNKMFPKKGIDVYSGFATIFGTDIPGRIFRFSIEYPILLRIDDQYISWLLYKLNISITVISSYAILPNKCPIYRNVSVIHRITANDMIAYSQLYK